MNDRQVIMEAAIARANIRAIAMMVENHNYLISGRPPPHGSEAFLKLIDEEAIGYNQVQSYLRGDIDHA